MCGVRFAREQRLVDFQKVRFDDRPVRHDGIARLQEQAIAEDHFCGWDLPDLAVANDTCFGLS